MWILPTLPTIFTRYPVSFRLQVCCRAFVAFFAPNRDTPSVSHPVSHPGYPLRLRAFLSEIRRARIAALSNARCSRYCCRCFCRSIRRKTRCFSFFSSASNSSLVELVDWPVAILMAAMLSLVAVTTEGESETGSEHFGPQMLSIQLR